MGSRTWIKIYCDKWLSGTLREEDPEIRSVWIDLLALAGSGRYGDIGEIKIMNDVPLTDPQIAQVLRISLELWRKAKTRFIDTDRIKVTADNIISITNWGKYQSEYERQRVYRTESDKKKLHPEVTTESNSREREKRKRKEKGEKLKRKEDVPAASFITYKEKLRTNFPELDIDAEWERCQIWYRDHTKPIKSPSLALGNWCGKEREIRKESGCQGKTAGVNRINPDDPNKFIKGKYGHMVGR